MSRERPIPCHPRPAIGPYKYKENMLTNSLKSKYSHSVMKIPICRLQALAATTLVLLLCLSCRPLSADRFRVHSSLDESCLKRGNQPEAVSLEGTGFAEMSCATSRVWVRGQDRPLETEALVRLKKHVANKLMALDGVIGVGLGACCLATPSIPKHLCIAVMGRACETSTRDVLEVLADAADETSSQGTIGLRLELNGRVGPRCLPSDPMCGPLGGTNAPVGDARVPIHAKEPSFGRYSGGTCAHDGECVKGGCGNHCIGWRARPFTATCEAYDVLEDAYCGCVDNTCTWFVR